MSTIMSTRIDIRVTGSEKRMNSLEMLTAWYSLLIKPLGWHHTSLHSRVFPMLNYSLIHT